MDELQILSRCLAHVLLSATIHNCTFPRYTIKYGNIIERIYLSDPTKCVTTGIQFVKNNELLVEDNNNISFSLIFSTACRQLLKKAQLLGYSTGQVIDIYLGFFFLIQVKL